MTKATEFCGDRQSIHLGSPQQTAVEDALFTIRREMAIPRKPPWSRCVFRLKLNGKMKFDVTYPD